MITTTCARKIESDGVGVSSQFKIKATAKAFRILSDGLYSDKITAILRELSCNALDSHIAAKNFNPFVVHMPNLLEPHFSIRDYGTGLDHDDVMNIFTTYFESTKVTSNDFVGCLGLGCKSPFSYVDQFAVIAWKDGVKRTYNAYIDENDMPSIVMMGEQFSKEHDGIEISFPVERKDFDSFIYKAKSVYSYFPIKPEFKGHDLKIQPVEYSFSEKLYGIKKCGSGPSAIMGGVSYPLGDLDSSEINEKNASILRLNIDIFFEIGELEKAASGEKLSYTQSTRKAINNKLEIVYDHITNMLKEKVKDCSTLWDKKLMYYELSRGSYAAFSHILSSNEIWGGDKIENNWISFENTFIMSAYVREYRRRRRSMSSGYHYKLKPTSVINVIPNVLVFEKDRGRYKMLRLKKYFEDKNIIDPSSYNIYVIDTKSVKDFKRVTGYNGNIQKLSTMDYDKSLVSSYSGNSKINPLTHVKIMKYTGKGYNPGEKWEAADVDTEEEDIIYVTIDRYRIHGNDPAEYLKNRISLLEKLGINVGDIYGIREGDIAKHPEIKENWITFDEFYKESITNARTDENFEEMAISYGYTQFAKHDMEDLIKIVTHKDVINGFSDSIKNTIDKIILARKVRETKYQFLVAIYGGSADGYYVGSVESSCLEKGNEYKDVFSQVITNILEEYPMLKFIPNSYMYGEDKVKHGVEYVKTMNKIKNNA